MYFPTLPTHISKPVLFVAIPSSSMASISSPMNKLSSSVQPLGQMRVLKERSGLSEDAAQNSMGIGLQSVLVMVVGL